MSHRCYSLFAAVRNLQVVFRIDVTHITGAEKSVSPKFFRFILSFEITGGEPERPEDNFAGRDTIPDIRGACLIYYFYFRKGARVSDLVATYGFRSSSQSITWDPGKASLFTGRVSDMLSPVCTVAPPCRRPWPRPCGNGSCR